MGSTSNWRVLYADSGETCLQLCLLFIFKFEASSCSIYESFSLGQDKPCLSVSHCCLLQCKQVHNVQVPRLLKTLFVSEPVLSENQQLKLNWFPCWNIFEQKATYTRSTRTVLIITSVHNIELTRTILNILKGRYKLQQHVAATNRFMC